MNTQDLINKIKNLKEKLKHKIIIPVHHYQSIDIVKFADFIGDSYKLAVECSRSDAEFIIFCGVLFMAEGASILGKPDQKVILPETSACCPMADMADIVTVKKAYDLISKEIKKDLVPVVYMNSYADLKSFCGEKNGSVCTSSNAEKIMNYYLKQNKAVLFFPDYYLGKNTANKMGINEKNTVKIKQNLTLETNGDIKEANIFLWNGFCPIHQNFTVGDIKYLREKYQNIKIIVHPECSEEVVNNADMTGSTEKIYKIITDSPEGAIWGVGTETTFVNRLSYENSGKTVLPLKESRCRNMMKNTLDTLYSSLQSVIDNIEKKFPLKKEIKVKEEYRENAKKALKKMIDIVEN